MIDVLLVLLIIFMAVLPSMRKAIDIQLPDPNPTVAAGERELESDRARGAAGRQVRDQQRSRSTRGSSPARLKEIYDPRPEKIIFVKGDPDVKYADVIDAMDVARGAGVKVIGVPPKDTPGAQRRRRSKPGVRS